MKKCKFTNNDLLNYCYGQIGPKKAIKIKDHLVTCHQCSSKVRAFEEIISLAKEKGKEKTPANIFDNYTQEVLDKVAEKEKLPLSSLAQERLSNLAENLKFIFSPKLVPVAVVASILILSFILFRQSKVNLVEVVNQEVVLLEQLGEYTEEILLAQNGEILGQELELTDEIIFARLEEEAEAEEIFSDFQLLQELEEYIISDDISDDLEMLDELELEATIS